MYLTMVFQYFESALYTLVVTTSTNLWQALRLSGTTFVQVVCIKLVNPSFEWSKKLDGSSWNYDMTIHLCTCMHQVYIRMHIWKYFFSKKLIKAIHAALTSLSIWLLSNALSKDLSMFKKSMVSGVIWTTTNSELAYCITMQKCVIPIHGCDVIPGVSMPCAGGKWRQDFYSELSHIN